MPDVWFDHELALDVIVKWLAYFDLSLDEYYLLVSAKNGGVDWNSPLRAQLVQKLMLRYKPGKDPNWIISEFGFKLLKILERGLGSDLKEKGYPSLKIVLDKVRPISA
jgi:hypothetical protein